jgi:hypothetical protein
MTALCCESDRDTGGPLEEQVSKLQDGARRRLEYQPGLVQRIEQQDSSRELVSGAKYEIYKTVNRAFKVTTSKEISPGHSIPTRHRETRSQFLLQLRLFQHGRQQPRHTRSGHARSASLFRCNILTGPRGRLPKVHTADTLPYMY